MRNKSIALILMVLLVTVLTACGGDNTPTTVPAAAPTATKAAAAAPTATTAAAAPTATTATTSAATATTGSGSSSGGKTYVLVPKNLGNPYFDTANKGAQAAAKE